MGGGRHDHHEPQQPVPRGAFAPVAEEVTVTELRSPARCPTELDGRYLRNGPNPISAPIPPPTTGSWATAWCTACALRDGAGRVVPQPVGALGRGGRRARRAAPPRPRPRRVRLLRQHATSSATPAARSPSSKPADGPTSSPTSSTPSARATSTAPCRAATRPTRTATRRPGELHALSYFFGWGEHGAVLGDRHRRARAAHGRHRRRRQPDDARLLADRPTTSCSTTCPVTFDAGRGRAARRVRCVGPWPSLMSRVDRPPAHPRVARRRPCCAQPDGHGLPVRLGRDAAGPRRRAAPRRRRLPTSSGSRSSPATCTTRSTRTRTATTASCSTSCATRGCSRRDRTGPNEGTPTLDRWTIDRTAGKVLEERLDDRGQEFPAHRRAADRPPPPLRLRAHRRDATARTSRRSDALLKHDLAVGQHRRPLVRSRHRGRGVRVRAPRRGQRRGRRLPAGLRAPPGRGPDRPDGARRRPRSRTSPPCTCPVRVPLGFHGNWVPA